MSGAGVEEAVRRAVRWVPALALAAGLGLLAAHGTHVYLLDDRLRDLDAGAEANFLTWLSVCAAACGALATGVHALLLPERRGLMVLLAAALAYVSLDDAISLHERLGDKAGEVVDISEDATSLLQLVLIAPILVTLLGATFVAARGAFPEVRRALLGGLGCLVAAVLVEQVGGRVTEHLEERGTRWPDVLRVGTEEALELAGVICLAAGFLALLCTGLLAAATSSRRG
jgi:hypothetical protein